MKYSPRYRLFPDEQHREHLSWTVDVVRQVYNDALKRFNELPESAGTVRQRVVAIRDELPAKKDWWDDLNRVYSTVLQNVVMRVHQNITNLGKLKANGYDVGELRWKSPREF